jgi:polyhydroxyalkanoate synthesis regulator protein
MRSQHDASQPVIVKSYARSRIYDTNGLRYVTLDIIRAWSAAGIAFAVIDTETEEDVTRVLLA